MEKKYYITTPIYYVNGAPHIGSATTTIAADTLTRYKKLRGEPVYFLTGVDENATKVVEAAQSAGQDPMKFVDKLSDEFKSTWKKLHVEYDDFIRTTEDRHVKTVQAFFTRLMEKGYVYKDVYEGWYSVSDETFLRDSEVENGVSKESGKPVKRVTEENYFFKLSAFGERLLEEYKKNPKFWQPEFRANEVVKFIEEGLRDMCITRKNTGWGIPVPNDPDKVIYVWFDALINYVTATGWLNGEEQYKTLWPASVHLMAKEIFVRFHATLWPAMLMALDIPIPEVVFGHGWLTVGGEKGSKSSGNLPHPIVAARELAEKSGCTFKAAVDAIRFLLLREMRFGEDSEYSPESFARRFNSDLANDLGNVLNRTLAMTQKYTGGKVIVAEVEDQVIELIKGSVNGYITAIDEFRFDKALDSVWVLVSGLNKYLDDRAPWRLAKTGEEETAAKVLYSCVEGVRVVSRLISPYMPYVASEIDRQLGIDKPYMEPRWKEVENYGLIPAGHILGLPEPIFPRIDMTKDIAEKPKVEKPAEPKKETAGKQTHAEPEGLITIDDFKKVQLKTAKVIAAEAHPNANKLLKLTIEVGDEQRTLVAGIADSYKPEEVIGKTIVVLVNLQPAVIRGVESQGMMLAADSEGKAVFLTTDKPVPSGVKVR